MERKEEKLCKLEAKETRKKIEKKVWELLQGLGANTRRAKHLSFYSYLYLYFKPKLMWNQFQ